MVRMAADPLTSTFTRRSMFLTLPLVLRAASRIRVEVFLATECPISNRYVPELNRIAGLYQPKGVEMIGYFPERGLAQARLDRWQQDFAPAFPVRRDELAKQARKAGATLTPEVAIFGEKLIYRGRIDDRYVSWGKSRREPSRRDLIETLELLIGGKPVSPRFTKTWGCYIE